jgi:TonB family protein
MNKRPRASDADFRASLPPELGALDEELSSIRMEERASFGPELEAELLRTWKRRRFRKPPFRVSRMRILMAACLGCLMVAGIAVPSARASVVRLVRSVLAEAPLAFSQEAEVELPEIRVEEPEDAAADDLTRAVLSPPPVGEGDDPLATSGGALPEVEFTFPEILHRREAEETIASFYPRALQQAGIGGAVRLLLWVDSLGRVDHIQMRKGSDYRNLNLAAMQAARHLRFRPASRAGKPVGTWVEFEVQFVPPTSRRESGSGQPESAGGGL